MRIDKLSLLNFRCFRQLDITFDEHITILVAPNGAGKTTVLDAIRLALFPFIRGFDASLYVKDKSLAIRTEDVRLVFRPEALNMEMSSPAMITATGEWESGKTATWMLDKRGEQPPHEDKTAAQLTRWGEQLQTLVREEHNLQQVELPLMLYLGTARLWYQERYEAQLLNSVWITAPFHVCLVMTIAFLPHQIISNLNNGIAGYGLATVNIKSHNLNHLQQS